MDCYDSKQCDTGDCGDCRIGKEVGFPQRKDQTCAESWCSALGDIHNGDCNSCPLFAHKEANASLRARLAEAEGDLSNCRQAIGLASTFAPAVVMNAHDPMAMMQEIAEYLRFVAAERDAALATIEAVRNLAFRIDCDVMKSTVEIHAKMSAILTTAPRSTKGESE